MSALIFRIIFALFLIAHGLIHVSLSTVPLPAPGALQTPFWPGWWRDATDPHWLASRLNLPSEIVLTAGWVLWVAVVVGFSLSGIGLLGLPGLNTIWQGTAIFGAAASLVLLAFYWHPWLVIGVVIDVAMLASIWQQWPVTLFASR
jgi:hypothetical protein